MLAQIIDDKTPHSKVLVCPNLIYECWTCVGRQSYFCFFLKWVKILNKMRFFVTKKLENIQKENLFKIKKKQNLSRHLFFRQVARSKQSISLIMAQVNFSFLFQVLIFSQMTKMLDILGDYCYLRDIPYCRLDGKYSMDERKEQVWIVDILITITLKIHYTPP